MSDIRGKRVRFRNLHEVAVAMLAAVFLGLGGNSVLHERWNLAILLFGISAAWVAYAQTAGLSRVEKWIEARYQTGSNVE